MHMEKLIIKLIILIQLKIKFHRESNSFNIFSNNIYIDNKTFYLKKYIKKIF